jgi:hypothetical protein
MEADNTVSVSDRDIREMRAMILRQRKRRRLIRALNTLSLLQKCLARLPEKKRRKTLARRKQKNT